MRSQKKNFGVRRHILSYLSGPFSASFWHFLILKANFIRKNDWPSAMSKQLLRLDILYRMVRQLTLFDFYFLRYSWLIDTRWCRYKEFSDFQNIFWLPGLIDPEEIDSDKNIIRLDTSLVRNVDHDVKFWLEKNSSVELCTLFYVDLEKTKILHELESRSEFFTKNRI